MITKTVIKPHHLKKGDAVALVSLSRPLTRRDVVRKGVKLLERFGLKVSFSENIFKNYGCYMAGTANERTNEFHRLIANKKIRAIFNTSGGMSANQVLDKLDFRLIKRNPKIIYGFSDITTILNPIFEKTGIITFHGPTLQYWSDGPYHLSRKSMHHALFGATRKYEITGPSNWKTIKPGRASGRLAGGNLTIVRNFLATPYEIDWKNRIFFWEEVGEDLEGIDNMLTHLRLAKVFNKISGMIIGKNKIAAPESEIRTPNCRLFGFRKMLLDVAKGYQFPIISNVDFGHDLKTHLTIPVGARVEIIARPDHAHILVSEGVVRG